MDEIYNEDGRLIFWRALCPNPGLEEPPCVPGERFDTAGQQCKTASCVYDDLGRLLRMTFIYDPPLPEPSSSGQ